MAFVGFASIKKTPSVGHNSCKDWVATEKVHGSSFQFFTEDGETILLASRRNILTGKASFLKCDLNEFHDKYRECVQRAYRCILHEEKWAVYKGKKTLNADEGDDEEESVALMEESVVREGQSAIIVTEDGIDPGGTRDGGNGDARKDGEVENASIRELSEEKENGGCDCKKKDNEKDDNEFNDRDDDNDEQKIHFSKKETYEYPVLRIYGELYGGGGILKNMKDAVQKEIIYTDDFRFYVFGMSINRKWVTVAEMNEICREAGFPYFAVPVCEPKPTVAELIECLQQSGYMKSRSRMTEQTTDYKTNIEGVVITPLTRQPYDFHLYPVKLLSSAFSDVRASQSGKKNQRPNYCTKARYHSVISKLDLHERADLEFVQKMFVEDILEESGETDVSNNKRKGWARSVHTWLAKDGYVDYPEQRPPKKDNHDGSSDNQNEEKGGVREKQEVEVRKNDNPWSQSEEYIEAGFGDISL